ncbi:hypothetical protein [Streptomyces sp. NPDC017988]|uniref:hypothetical protein n=1 Tax=Streptomyces sp. NPDC017988 TaxID=3365025 RepID=UPI003787D360
MIVEAGIEDVRAVTPWSGTPPIRRFTGRLGSFIAQSSEPWSEALKRLRYIGVVASLTGAMLAGPVSVTHADDAVCGSPKGIGKARGAACIDNDLDRNNVVTMDVHGYVNGNFASPVSVRYEIQYRGYRNGRWSPWASTGIGTIKASARSRHVDGLVWSERYPGDNVEWGVAARMRVTYSGAGYRWNPWSQVLTYSPE